MKTLAACLLVATAAHAGQTLYLGGHPIPARAGGGYCYLEPRHSHEYVPEQPSAFRIHAGAFFFAGDPTRFGYEGPRYTYAGPHPLRVDLVLGESGGSHEEICRIEGAHFHPFMPAPGDPASLPRPPVVDSQVARRHPSSGVVVASPLPPTPQPRPAVQVRLPLPGLEIRMSPPVPFVAAPPPPQQPAIVVPERHGHHKDKRCKHRHGRRHDDDDDDDDDDGDDGDDGEEYPGQHRGLNRDDD